jgi:hypothetical protein
MLDASPKCYMYIYMILTVLLWLKMEMVIFTSIDHTSVNLLKTDKTLLIFPCLICFQSQCFVLYQQYHFAFIGELSTVVIKSDFNEKDPDRELKIMSDFVHFSLLLATTRNYHTMLMKL